MMNPSKDQVEESSVRSDMFVETAVERIQAPLGAACWSDSISPLPDAAPTELVGSGREAGASIDMPLLTELSMQRKNLKSAN